MLIFSQRSLSSENSYALAATSLGELPPLLSPSAWLGTLGSVDRVERYERLRSGVRPEDVEELDVGPLGSTSGY